MAELTTIFFPFFLLSFNDSSSFFSFYLGISRVLRAAGQSLDRCDPPLFFFPFLSFGFSSFLSLVVQLVFCGRKARFDSLEAWRRRCRMTRAPLPSLFRFSFSSARHPASAPQRVESPPPYSFSPHQQMSLEQAVRGAKEEDRTPLFSLFFPFVFFPPSLCRRF